MRFGVAVLAGGRGVRMGGAKPSRLLGKASLLERSTARAFSWGAPVVLVLRSADQASLPGVRTLCDAAEVPGPLGGLCAALCWARDSDLDAVLTIPCDMPFLPDDLPWRLAAQLTEGHAVAMAASGERRHPICSLWRPGVLSAIEMRAGLGRHSLHGVADHAGCVEVSWPVLAIDPFFNVNSPEDMAQAERQIAHEI